MEVESTRRVAIVDNTPAPGIDPAFQGWFHAGLRPACRIASGTRSTHHLACADPAPVTPPPAAPSPLEADPTPSCLTVSGAQRLVPARVRRVRVTVRALAPAGLAASPPTGDAEGFSLDGSSRGRLPRVATDLSPHADLVLAWPCNGHGLIQVARVSAGGVPRAMAQVLPAAAAALPSAALAVGISTTAAGTVLACLVRPERLPPRGSTRGMQLALRLLGDDGRVVAAADDLLSAAGTLADTRGHFAGFDSPAFESTCRMAVGGGQVCLHLGHLMVGTDGLPVQAGSMALVDLPGRLPPSPQLLPLALTSWQWLGSRSLDQRCAHDRHRECFVLASLTDGFPRGVLVAATRAGAAGQQLVCRFPGAPGDPWVPGELGGLVVLRESYAVSYTSDQGAQPDARDVFVALLAPDFRTTPLQVRVTSNSPGTYAIHPKLARIGRLLLVAWTNLDAASGQVQHLFALVSSQAQLVERPFGVEGASLAKPDDLLTDPDGAVHWVTGDPPALSWHRMWLGRD